MSWQLVAILFAISAFEGVRRLGPEQLVLRSNPLAGWRVVSPIRLWGEWHIVSVLPPLFVTVVIPLDVSPNAFSGVHRDVPAFTRSTLSAIALRMLGGLDLLALVLGIPWSVAKFGGAGLLISLGIVLTLSAVIFASCAVILIRQGEHWKPALRTAMSFLSPFASPFAGEAMLSARMRRYPRLTAIAGLLGETRFHALIRRSVYDVEVRAPSHINGWLEQIALSLPKSERAKIIDSASADCSELERYCPRCAEKYLLESSSCAECDGVPLRQLSVR